MRGLPDRHHAHAGILERITGRTEGADIELLEELGETIKDTAMCGLGQTAPNPVLSTIRYFREEYGHIRDKVLPGKRVRIRISVPRTPPAPRM